MTIHQEIHDTVTDYARSFGISEDEIPAFVTQWTGLAYCNFYHLEAGEHLKFQFYGPMKSVGRALGKLGISHQPQPRGIYGFYACAGISAIPADHPKLAEVLDEWQPFFRLENYERYHVMLDGYGVAREQQPQTFKDLFYMLLPFWREAAVVK